MKTTSTAGPDDQSRVDAFAEKVKRWRGDPSQMTERDRAALNTLAEALLAETHPTTSDLVHLEDGRVLFLQRLN